VAGAGLAGVVVSPGAWANLEAKAKPKTHHSTKAKPKPKAGSASKELKSLSSSLGNGEQHTFKAVYTLTAPSETETVTVEQQPPKSLYSFGTSGSIIDNGTTTYFCGGSGGQVTCIPESGGSNPLASLLDLFSPTTVRSDFQAAEAEVVAKAHGYSISFSTATIAGQASKCASVSGPSGSGKYCVTNSGILASLTNSSGQGFKLTSYSSSVSSSDFSPPPGATIESVP